MALIESDRSISFELPPTGSLSSVYFTENKNEEPDTTIEIDLENRFNAERISDLSESILIDKFGIDWSEKLGGRQFYVGLLDANDPNSDAPRMVETTRFSEQFKRPMSRIYEEYSNYDDHSTFIVVIDTNSKNGRPSPAGVIRMINPNNMKGLKSINDLVEDKPGNPWINEIKSKYFDEIEGYNAGLAWTRLCEKTGVYLDPSESFDVATIAILTEYAGHNGDIDSTSISLYHNCLRYVLGNGGKNLVSIQDVRPLAILQQYGNCFSLFEDLKPHPYGGPYDTIPAWAELQEGMRRVQASGWGSIFIGGDGIDKSYYMIKDHTPSIYSDDVVTTLPREALKYS